MTKPRIKPHVDHSGKLHAPGQERVRLAVAGQTVTREVLTDTRDVRAEEMAEFLSAGPNEQAILLEILQLDSDPEEEDRI